MLHHNRQILIVNQYNTGGAYDTVPEVNMLLALFNHSDKYVPVLFDEAGELCRNRRQ